MIEKLLAEIGEDKVDNICTTSFEYKKDIWDFFQGFSDKVAVEFGTHKGQTTRILSHLFKKVYTINLNDSKTAKKLNKDRTNIEYICMDVYSASKEKLPEIIPETVDMFLIDAGHQYHQVISDITSAFTLNVSPNCYFVFDDYGLEHYSWEVRRAVDEVIQADYLEVVKNIGHKPGFNFGGYPPRILTKDEGLITKIKNR